MISSEEKQKVIKAAVAVRQNAYAPYSRFSVGAALLTDSGEIFSGVNVECASYPLTVCAERSAISNAVSAGERSFKAIAVVTDIAGAPCGGCRQVLREFGGDYVVYLCNDRGEVVKEFTVDELLPGAFTPEDLERS